jgi:hypothetical protein
VTFAARVAGPRAIGRYSRGAFLKLADFATLVAPAALSRGTRGRHVHNIELSNVAVAALTAGSRRIGLARRRHRVREEGGHLSLPSSPACGSPRDLTASKYLSDYDRVGNEHRPQSPNDRGNL